MIKTAVIGIGKWGTELVRVLDNKSELIWCCNLRDRKKLISLKKQYPHIKTTQKINDVLNDKSVQAVFIATPIATHYKIAKKCLLNSKDVFLEKPLAEKVTQAIELEKLAKKMKKTLSIGFTFMYAPAYKKIKNLIKKKRKVQISISWLKWGTFKENIFFNLASHDIAFLIDIFGAPILVKKRFSVGAISDSDIAMIDLHWKKHRASLYYNRLSATKCRTMTIQCSNSTFATDGTRVQVLNKQNGWDNIFEDHREPLSLEIEEFLLAVKKIIPTRTPAELAVKVQNVLQRLI